MKKTRPESLGAVLSTVLAQDALGAGGALLKVRRAWPDAAGDAMAAHTVPTAFRAGAVLVKVEHALFSQELKLREREVLARLRELTGLEVRELRFRSGGVALGGPTVQHASGVRDERAGASSRARAAASDVSDPELRESLGALLDRLGRGKEPR